MKIMAIALDYDRTITDENLQISEAALEAIRGIRRRMKIVLVSGRHLDFLKAMNDKYRIADAVVAENGAVIYLNGGKHILGAENGKKIKAAFQDQQGMFIREVIVATTTEYLDNVRRTIQQKNLSGIVDIEINRTDVMIMPKGVNKGLGLAEALRLMKIKPENTACIGDGENDLKLFSTCGFKVAVANAVDLLKEKADFVCSKPYGEGIKEFVEFVEGKYE